MSNSDFFNKIFATIAATCITAIGTFVFYDFLISNIIDIKTENIKNVNELLDEKIKPYPYINFLKEVDGKKVHINFHEFVKISKEISKEIERDFEKNKYIFYFRYNAYKKYMEEINKVDIEKLELFIGLNKKMIDEYSNILKEKKELNENNDFCWEYMK